MSPRPDITFRIGDRVRTTQATWGEDTVPVGALGTIVQPPPLLAVTFDHDPVGDGTGVWAICDWQITHVGRSTKAQARLRRRHGAPALFLYALNRYRLSAGDTP